MHWKIRPDRVDVFVGVEPAGAPVSVTQRDLAPVGNHAGLAANDGAETALQAGLELAGHERVVGAGLVEDAKVEVEKGQVEDDRHAQLDSRPHLHQEKSDLVTCCLNLLSKILHQLTYSVNGGDK